MKYSYKVAEIFGPTLQGEGPSCGALTHFLRFGGCDFKCVWCDSAPAVKPDLVHDLESLEPQEMLYRLELLPPAPFLTISGGNPVLHNLPQTFLHELKTRYKEIHVETQGSLLKPWLWFVDQIVISPKPPSSKMVQLPTRVEEFIRGMSQPTGVFPQNRLPPRMHLKVVVATAQDITYALSLWQYIQGIQELPVGQILYLQPATITSGILEPDYYSKLQAPIMHRLLELNRADVRVIPQVHKLLELP